MKRRVLLQGAAGAALLAGGSGQALAQSRAETLRYVTGATINTLDTTMFGATRESFGLSMNVYDRLFTFGRKKVADYWVFDPDTIRGELAKSYSISPDNKVITITLRPDATWHDGTPVTGGGRQVVARSRRRLQVAGRAAVHDGFADQRRPVQDRRSDDGDGHARQARSSGAGQPLRLLRHHDQQQAGQAACHH